jgi:hypothetical protein
LASFYVFAIAPFLCSFYFSGHANSGTADRAGDIEVFVRLGLPHCEAAKVFLNKLQEERPELLIVTHDVGEDRLALSRLQKLTEDRGIPRGGVPSFLAQVVLGGISLVIGAVNVKNFAAYRKIFSLAIPEAAHDVLAAAAVSRRTI